MNEIKKLVKEYDPTFVPSQEYLDNMPDIQNSPYDSSHIIERVGISGFKVPINIAIKPKVGKEWGASRGVYSTDAIITGSVSLEAEKRGINMSRILRTFYDQYNEEDVFSITNLCNILREYKTKLDSFEAQIDVSFQYRLLQDSLVSVDKEGNKNKAWQYYDVTLSAEIDADGKIRKTIITDFLYSSTCPCSTELSYYNADTIGAIGSPHAQRSTMRSYIDFEGDILWIEDIIRVQQEALKTETQTFVKREDEAAFAWLSAAYPKFVEDAIRLVGIAVAKLPSVTDFKLICSHNESLHSHNAIAVYVRDNKSRYSTAVSLAEWKSLVK